MKKSELLKLKPIYATPTMMRSAANDKPTRVKLYRGLSDPRYKRSFYIRGRCDGNIVRFAIFLSENMRLKSNKASFEIFIDIKNRNFITYDYTYQKWSEAKIDLLPWPSYKRWGETYNNRELNKFVQRQLGTENGGYDGILEFQQAIRSEQLQRKHKKETDPWDEKMAKVLPEPTDWERWISKQGITENYIFYKYVKGGAKTGYCSWCERDVEIKSPRHNAIGKCRRCGHQIQYKSVGKMAMRVDTTREIVHLMQKYDNGFIIRMYEVHKAFYKDDYEKPEIHYNEIRRVLYDSKQNSYESYYYGLYKQCEDRWIFNGGIARTGNWYFRPSWLGKVYKHTIPSVREFINRTGLPEMIHSLPVICPEIYLSAQKEKPYLEQLAKAGLTQLAFDIIYNRFSEDKFQFAEMNNLGKSLLIDRGRLQRLRANNGGVKALQWLRYEKAHNKCIDDKVIAWYIENKIAPDKIAFITDRMSEKQIKNYLIKQQNDTHSSFKEILSTWDDYLKMAIRAKMNVNDEIVYRTKKLKQRHDELVNYLGNKDTAIRAGEIDIKFPNVDKVCDEIRGKYEYTDGNYAIIVPDNIEAILQEGEVLHHCIDKTDRYFERIHNKESFLMFLRKADEVEKPWYTLEVEPDGTIRQKRTEYDRQNKDLQDAEEFLIAWQKYVRRNITKADMKLAAKSKNLRIKEFKEMREKEVRINGGYLSGHLLADVLEADLMESRGEEIKNAS